MTTIHHTRRAAALAAVGALALAGCGGSSSSSGTKSTASTTDNQPPSSTVTIVADPSGKPVFATKTVTAKAGKVKVVYNNTSSVAHNLNVVAGANTLLVTLPNFSNGSRTVILNLSPGTLHFYSSVNNDQKQGMNGVLVVKK